ncbi:MAG: phage tail terminator-like protein [Pusillimonas sp.]
MSKRQIRAAFESRLSAWTKAQTPVVPVAWENTPFTPTTYPFLRAFIVPDDTDSLDLAGDHRLYTGLFQISVIGEVGKGAAQAERIAESIAELFPLNLRMAVTDGVVLVYSPMSEGPAMPDSGIFTLPVWCRYRMDTI